VRRDWAPQKIAGKAAWGVQQLELGRIRTQKRRSLSHADGVSWRAGSWKSPSVDSTATTVVDLPD